MYYTFFEKQRLKRKPFHQKVLHFQYDVPLCQVRQLFALCVETSDEGLLVAAESLDAVKEKFPYNEAIWTPCHHERKSFGIFNQTEGFYIRLEIDALENTKDLDEVCGNIFFFAEESVLLETGNRLEAGCGQLVIEGTADYFALFED